MKTMAQSHTYRALLALVLTGFAALTATATPLDDYVHAEDDAYRYELMPDSTVAGSGFEGRVYRMTSQHWLDESQVDRTEWWHWVTVYIPKEREHNKAMLFIGGGSNSSNEPPKPEGPLSNVAVMTNSIVIEVGQIPNQPLRFTGEQLDKYKERGRVEDELIAYGWDKYLRGGDPIWLARLPMTKAIVRAMDMVQDEFPELDGFFVAGGSKRGWTTWTVAAVDDRVIGIAPAVIDVLSVSESLDNHWNAYGFWAPAVGDYAEMDILSRRHTPEFAELRAVVDPISYVDRLTMPKYIVNSAGDQFFPPDSWKFYFGDLQGEKYLRYMPNTDHGLNIEAYFNLASFYNALLEETPRPEFDWKQTPDGGLEVRCTTEPESVTLWQAHNPAGRDFRMEEIGKVWESTPLEAEDGVYRALPTASDDGFTAFLIEVTFPNPDFSQPLKFTTGISVVPDEYPGKDIPE